MCRHAELAEGGGGKGIEIKSKSKIKSKSMRSRHERLEPTRPADMCR